MHFMRWLKRWVGFFAQFFFLCIDYESFFFLIWLYWVLVAAAACGIFPCSMQALQHEGSVVVMHELTSPTGD